MKKILVLALAAMTMGGASLMAAEARDVHWAKSGEWRRGPARDFSGADVRGVDFTGAWLQGADFSGAQIDGANFSRANVYDANFGGATGEARQSRADLKRKGARF